MLLISCRNEAGSIGTK